MGSALLCRRRSLFLTLRVIPLILHPIPRPSQRSPPLSIVISSHFSIISAKSDLKDPILFHPKPPIPAINVDYDSDFDEPIDIADDPDLHALIGLVTQAKSLDLRREEALKFLHSSFESEKKTDDLVLATLWELRREVESVLLVFKWAGACVWDCASACNLMVWVLGKSRRFDLAWSLVRKMHSKKILTQKSFVILMERYASANDPKKAIKTFHAMEKFTISFDSTEAFFSLLRALCKNKNVEEAEDLLHLNQKFFPLETDSFNIILDGWCNVMVDVVEAKRVWREMSSSCIAPNGTSYSHMISCFARSGNLFDSLRLYDEMKKRGCWVPNLPVYNSLIYALTSHNCFEEAKKIFDKIIEDALKPDLATYHSMIFPLCEAEMFEDAWRVMSQMIERGLSPTLETFHAFAKAENPEGTVKLLNRIRDSGSRPNINTFLLIIENFFRRNDCESALRVWYFMSKYNIIPDSSLYIEMVRGLDSHGWTVKAKEFYNEMKSKGFPPDPRLEKRFKIFFLKHRNHWGRGREYIIKPIGFEDNRKSVI